jgi:hypothetical protein
MASTDPPDASAAGDAPEPPRVHKPGAHGGVENILREQFGVSSEPALARDEAVRRVRDKLAAEGVAYEVLHISDAPVHRGALFDAAGRRVLFPEPAAYDRCTVVLVDPDRRARWAHDAWWAFVPLGDDGTEQAPVVLRPTTLPEHERGPVRFYPVR